MPKKYVLQPFSIMIIMAMILGSCGFFRSPDRESCHKILPAEKVTDILTDIYLMEGYLSNRQNTLLQTRDSVEYFFAGVFSKHGVTYQEFKGAMDCYLLHPEDMEKIHEEILNRLSIKMSEAEAAHEGFLLERQQAQTKTDSLSQDSLNADGPQLFLE
ncbi:MAG: DUF4296 domain-containing protein [Bacteroidales bacterium]|jgi:hypothetical protein|nr:DUF4296 domain-containing protein [Bacteroidales bacterium]NLM91502.1 DUF4296 domain-containing protein [Bacteroidales bacterium]